MGNEASILMSVRIHANSVANVSCQNLHLLRKYPSNNAYLSPSQLNTSSPNTVSNLRFSNYISLTITMQNSFPFKPTITSQTWRPETNPAAPPPVPRTISSLVLLLPLHLRNTTELSELGICDAFGSFFVGGSSVYQAKYFEMCW